MKKLLPIILIACMLATPASAVMKYTDANRISVRKTLNKLQNNKNFKEGISWDNSKVYYATTFSAYSRFTAKACMAFAVQLTDTAWRKAFNKTLAQVKEKASLTIIKKGSQYPDLTKKIRVGDIVHLNNTHWVVITRISGGKYILAEGNFNKKVHWGRTLSKAEMKKTATELYTRWK